MNRLLTAFSAAVVIAVAGAGSGAMAQETGPEPEEQAREDAREARNDRDRAADRFCIQETGSRVVASRNARSKSERTECVAAGGRVYTREEIERTGATDLRDALRRLDPSLR